MEPDGRGAGRLVAVDLHVQVGAADVPADARELVANAIAMHYTPGVGLESGAEAYLLSAGAAVDVFGLRSNEIPDAVRHSVIQQYPRLGFKREFAGLLRAEAKQVPRGRAWYLHRFAMSDLSIRLAPFRDESSASMSRSDGLNSSSDEFASRDPS